MLRKVKTENGWVRGIEAADPRITAFKGIPFAAPPVGKNRWRSPQPCENWDGVKDCFRFAPISVQDTPGLGTDIYCREWHVDPEIDMGEDCLYLNVWTNAKSESDKLPVLVWFFGGGLQWGYPAEMEFDGERIARRGVVVVTVNYRINVFGFLAHPEITKTQPDAPSNFGNLDQQAGLKWVVRNIAAFGGDPENITIAGQSAGGGSVLSQIGAPSSKGLFKRAVIMSGLIRSPYESGGIGVPEPLESAEKNGQEFFDFLGVKSLDEARELDAFFVLQRYSEYASNHRRMFTVHDGQFCVGDPLQMLMNGECDSVPIIAGNTSDEFPTFLHAFNDKELAEKAEKLFGDNAEKFLSIPEVKNADKPGEYAKVSGIELSAKSLFNDRKIKTGKKDCYYYCFDADIPGDDNPGTFHSVDLWFFFETLAKCSRPYVGHHYDLARQMCNYFANFIKTGDPNGKDADGSEMPEWKPYDLSDKPCSMMFTKNGAEPVNEDEPPMKAFLIDRITEQIKGE